MTTKTEAKKITVSLSAKEIEFCSVLAKQSAITGIIGGGLRAMIDAHTKGVTESAWKRTIGALRSTVRECVGESAWKAYDATFRATASQMKAKRFPKPKTAESKEEKEIEAFQKIGETLKKRGYTNNDIMKLLCLTA